MLSFNSQDISQLVTPIHMQFGIKIFGNTNENKMWKPNSLWTMWRKVGDIFNFCLETREKEDRETHYFDAGVGQTKKK